ncbi:MAG: septal ring lytic transglycosylase RlpA family protein [Planctomycetota bacterium]
MSGIARARRAPAGAGLLLLLAAGACGPKVPPPTGVPPPVSGRTQTGYASWYGPRFHGRPTASGERYNMLDLTAAHRSFPFGTYVRVTTLANGHRIVVRINDRGPFVSGRIIDLSYAAAKILDLIPQGVMKVRLEVLDAGQGSRIHRLQRDLIKRKGLSSWSDREFREIEKAGG